MQICTIMQLGEAITCTRQSLNVTLEKKKTLKYAGAI